MDELRNTMERSTDVTQDKVDVLHQAPWPLVAT
jgi:hypothetical protein